MSDVSLLTIREVAVHFSCLTISLSFRATIVQALIVRYSYSHACCTTTNAVACNEAVVTTAIWTTIEWPSNRSSTPVHTCRHIADICCRHHENVGDIFVSATSVAIPPNCKPTLFDVGPITASVTEVNHANPPSTRPLGFFWLTSLRQKFSSPTNFSANVDVTCWQVWTADCFIRTPWGVTPWLTMTPLMSHHNRPPGMTYCDKVNRNKQTVYRNKVYIGIMLL